ncbi:putative disease resistance protein RGA3, partial [Phalaenopsis equestris]|uniref:putative disease resistance protein RGA3 n=1 Tax=Phalaenopsis equestris TaxID=78828 RepID=UPI0009E6280D
MPGIGMLKSLRELDWFSVKNEKGFKIGELEHLNELRRLRISSLESVKDAKEACIAKLCEKRNLTDLWLVWGDESKTLRNTLDTVLDEEVLENLQPHNKLEHLRIYAYMGAKSARWMDNANYIFNLKFIELSRCLEWETLPPFEQLPFLKTLFLHDMPKAKCFYNKFHGNGKACVFPSLERLDITKLEALEHWFDATEDAWPFPCLHILRLKDCPNLQELSSRPPNLWNLEIDNVGWKAFNWLPGIDDRCRYISIKNCSNFNYIRQQKNSETFKKIINKVIVNDLSVLLMEPLRSITSFEELSIEENDDLISFTIEAEQWFLQFSLSLLELNFRRLKSLQSLPSSLPRLSSLQVLCIQEAPQLQQLSNIPGSLERLDLEKLESLLCLQSLSAITSLQYLTLESIPLLKALPDLPPSLYELRLKDLNQLDCLPSCFPTLSSLQTLNIIKVPQLRELPGLPPSLLSLFLEGLNQLDCPPSFLSRLSSLDKLVIINLSQLRELQGLPPALSKLQLEDLDRLDCLPSSLANLSSLRVLWIINVPQLRDLPDLPPSLEHLVIEDCHPELMERYKEYSGSDWHKI